MNHNHYYQSKEQELEMHNTKLIQKSETCLKLRSFLRLFSRHVDRLHFESKLKKIKVKKKEKKIFWIIKEVGTD